MRSSYTLTEDESSQEAFDSGKGENTIKVAMGTFSVKFVSGIRSGQPSSLS